MQNNFKSPRYTLIYVFRINDSAHADCLKVGMTSLDCDVTNILSLQPNASVLNKAARQRINQYTQTAATAYDLIYTEVTAYLKGNAIECFTDKDVHRVLLRSGIQRKKFKGTWKQGVEWFVTDLETVKRAIKAVKEGRQSLTTAEVTQEQSPIIFRPEQREAIEKTKKQFKKSNKMLWNAKMRFGKTLSALQVVKDMNFSRTLILTHRPVVDSGWFEDFGKIFYDSTDFAYGSKNNGDSQTSLEARAIQGECKYVYFASIQDLRGSELVGGNFDKNNEVFATAWDCIIVDEAHEGTKTELGKAVMQELTKKETKILRLSGTPFNLLDDFKEDEIYTWDYVMEQRAKHSWDEMHFGDPNPYASLPTMNIYTYDLGRLLNEFIDEDVAFNFREFFRVNEARNFIHEKDVKAFLNLITKEDKESCYPFANEEYRNIFRHTLWMLPGVKEARALSTLLQSHPIFQHFKIVNVAGDGDQDEESRDALKAVEQAIGDNPDDTRTITLSCGRLTTGVSVKAWTAVFMLSGSYNTAASSYMQTIFRVQTPATINGRVKEQCYVFDFAPDRTLRVIAETAKISAKAGKTSNDDRKIMGEFLNFCPIISIEGSKMNQFDVPKMLEQLKRVYVERVVRNGFEDRSLYNDELMKLNDLALQEFDDLKKNIGQTKAMPKTEQVDINNQGLTNEEYEELEDLEKKSKTRGKEKQPLTEEEKKRLEELKKKTQNREKAISILRGISIRMPLLIYGAELNDETQKVTIDNFTSLIDPQSWEEFMPKGVTKQKFNNFKKYYDPDIFSAAGKRIRAMARAADKLSVEERIERITDIFSTFRNPDKETVLTPWRVVNMHVSDCFGGYTFFDETFKEIIHEPRFVDHGNVTAETFAIDSHLLEINSKSGLYPLYLTYNIYRTRLHNETTSPETLEEHLAIWDKTVEENIFVICKTSMAKAITRRTLLGFRKGKTNMWAPDDLINKIKNQPDLFIKKVHDLVGKDMKIDAIVGNPPYQVMDGGAGVSAKPVYNLFVDIARKIKPEKISMIMPAKWFTDGKGLGTFRESMFKDRCLSKIFDFIDSRECFTNVDIAGGVCYFLWNKKHKGDCRFISVKNDERVLSVRNFETMEEFIRQSEAINIVEKVKAKSDLFFNSIVTSRKPFGLATNVKPMETGSLTLKTNQGKGLYDEALIKVGREMILQWKVIISYLTAEHAGQTDKEGRKKILSSLDILCPNEICTETYLVFSSADTKEEADNIFKYAKTQFVRFMISQLAATQHLSKEKFALVPTQDFTSNSDIDWSKSVPEIDAQLYKKYGLSEEEITFIESMIKPM